MYSGRYQARGRCVSYHYKECKSILSCPSLCLTSHRSPMGKPSHPINPGLDGPPTPPVNLGPRGPPRRGGQHLWRFKWLGSGPKNYGRPASLRSTDSSLQSYYTADTSPSSPTSTCSSNMSFPYSVTSVHSYKSKKNILYPRREHPPPANTVVLSSQVRLLRFVPLSQYKFSCRTTWAMLHCNTSSGPSVSALLRSSRMCPDSNTFAAHTRGRLGGLATYGFRFGRAIEVIYCWGSPGHGKRRG